MDVTDTNSSCSSLFTNDQCNLLAISRVVCATLSLISSIFLISVIWLFRKYRRLLYRILLYIAACSVSNNVILLLADRHVILDNPWCKFRGIVGQFNIWALMLWQLCLTIQLYFNTVNAKPNRWMECIYHSICWGITFIVTIIPLASGKYGPAITWCWITDPQWRMWLFYIEYMAVILVILVLYAKVIYTVFSLQPRWRTHPSERNRYEVYKKRVRPMMLYPLAILVVSIFPIINRTQSIFRPVSESSFVLSLLHVISVPMWGILFAVIFSFDPETREELTVINIKVAIMNRFHDNRIEAVATSENHGSGKVKGKTPPHSNSAAKPTVTEQELSSLSNISIEPTTAYV